MNDILVSIVMPVYNAAEFLPDSIGDIIAQTYDNWEFICVDDGSTDDSAKVMSRFAAEDDRIKIITCKNRGGGAARNTGFHEAQGKYVFFLDADDRFEQNLIELSVAKAESEKSEIVVYNGDKFDYATGRVSSAPWLLFGMDKDASVNAFDITRPTIWNKLFLRAFLIDNEIYHQDERVTAFSLYFTAVAMLYAKKVSRLDKFLVHYRSDNPRSSLHKHDMQPLDTLNILIEIKNKLVQDGIYDGKKKIFLNFAIEEISERLRLFNCFEGYRDLYNALRERGFKELNLIDNDALLENRSLCDQKNRILNMSIGEYLYDRENKYRELGFLHGVIYLVPDVIREISSGHSDETLRVYLYGAGVVGKCYYAQLSKCSDITLVGWADRDYEKYGYPISSPQDINSVDFDLLLIAMEHEATAHAAKTSLVSQGILEDKILWERPEKYA